MQDDGIAFTNRGEDFNDALAELVPFASNVNAVLEVLRRDNSATSTLLSDGGEVLSAISQNPAQLQGLIRNANTVFAATARATAMTWPPRSRRSPRSWRRARADARRASRRSPARRKPLVKELQPAATPLSDALEQSAKLALPVRRR